MLLNKNSTTVITVGIVSLYLTLILIRKQLLPVALTLLGKAILANVSKTKELIVDFFRKKEAKKHTPVYISGAEVEQVNSYRFLGITITENLPQSSYITTLVKKKHRKGCTSYGNLGRPDSEARLWSTFFRGATESILTGKNHKLAWFIRAHDRKAR